MREGSNSEAAVKFGVDRKRIREWIKQEEQLKYLVATSEKGQKRKKVGGAGKKSPVKILTLTEPVKFVEGMDLTCLMTGGVTHTKDAIKQSRVSPSGVNQTLMNTAKS